MPSKKPKGSAEFDLVGLLRSKLSKPLNFKEVMNFVSISRNAIRYGGLSSRQQWLRLFDPSVTSLAKLPIGLFEQKAFILPRRYLPKSEAELARLCRQLIDRGEDKGHIEVMLSSWPTDWNLERHVAALWELRGKDKRFYECVVRGRHGRALRVIAGKAEVGGISIGRAKWLLGRQALLWCAMDVQMTTSRARVSFTKPFGSLLSSTMKVLKAGTALRLMRQALNILEVMLPAYQTEAEELRDGRNNAKIKGKLPRLLSFHAEKYINAHSKPVADYRRELDDSIPGIRAHISELRELFEYLENYTTEDLPPLVLKDGTVQRRTNRLRHFHPIWFSNLSPAAGMAVAQFRYVMAERHIDAMIEKASAKYRKRNLVAAKISPLPALPEDNTDLSLIIERVLDLSDSARRAQLRDADWKSRTKVSLGKIKDALDLIKAEPSLEARDPLDKAGLNFITDAMEFLQSMGRRRLDAFDARHSNDHRNLTYWHMDVVPEQRLAF